MKLNNFRGELTDISAKKEPLAVVAIDISGLQLCSNQCCFYRHKKPSFASFANQKSCKHENYA